MHKMIQKSNVSPWLCFQYMRNFKVQSENILSFLSQYFCYWSNLAHINVSDGKESVCSAGDLGLIPGGEDPLEKGMTTHSSILPGEFHGQRSLGGYSPWGQKESDITEWLTLLLFSLSNVSITYNSLKTILFSLVQHSYYFIVQTCLFAYLI